jgi:invasion protein IalB
MSAGRSAVIRRESAPGYILRLAALLVLCAGLPAGAQAQDAQVTAGAEAQAADPTADPSKVAWGLACQAPAPGETRCSVFQRQLTEAGEQVLSVELVGLETGQTPAVILTAPLGISLDASPNIQIDGASFASSGWKVCVQQGCIARVEAPDLADKLRTATQIVVSFQGPGEPPENIAIDVPIDGLSAGIDRIVQSNQ